jgi:hypothetical protein
MFTPFFCHW